MDTVERISYHQQIDDKLEYEATMSSGTAYYVRVDTWYASDHSLIARAHAENAPDEVVDAVEAYVQKQYDQ